MKKNTTYSLKPCPFCGYPAELSSDYRPSIKNCMTAYVRCTGCRAMGPIMDSCAGGKEGWAVYLWNFRPRPGYVRPKPEPRYDAVYFEGLDWLDSL